MAKVTYDVEHEPTYGSIRVQIDFDFKNDFGDGPRSMDDLIKEMVEFWWGWEDKFKENDNNYLNTFLKSLCQRCLSIALEHNYNAEGVKDKFINEEGWLPVDGSCGITLLSLDTMELSSQDDYTIKDLPF